MELREKVKQTPLRYALAIYLLCFALRAAEYLLLRTDQSIIGEAILHKLLGIAILGAAVWRLQYHMRGVGFSGKSFLRGTALGLLLGCGVMAVGGDGGALCEQHGRKPAARGDSIWSGWDANAAHHHRAKPLLLAGFDRLHRTKGLQTADFPLGGRE